MRDFRVQENGKTVFDVGAEEFAEDMEEIVTMGAWFAGACCGTTPAADTGNGRKMQRNHTGADRTEELYLCYLLLYGS